MRNLALLILVPSLLLAVAGCGGSSKKSPTDTAVPCNDETAIETVRKSVVRISTDAAVGTGIVVAENQILTNAHVVGDNDKVRVETPDGAEEGTVVGTDKVVDLALIQAATHALPAVRFAEPSSLKQGQHLLAIGYALDLPGEPSTTGGIFSALREIDGVHYVQTDAPINPGNSGGPLFTQCGEVVGLNTSGTRTGIGLAIDSATLRTVNSDLAKGAPSEKSPNAANDKSTAASQTPTADASNAETAFAKSMLLTAADFPSGWVETPNTTNDEENPLNTACGKATEQGKTGRATSSDFAADANAPTISEVVIVFGTDGDASAAIDAVPPLIDCAVKAINDGKLNNSGVEFSGTSSAKVTVDAPGDKAYAYQIKTTGTVTGQAGSEEALYFTLVYAKQGRVGYQLSVQGSGEPPDPAEDAAYAQKAAAKIKQQP